MDRRVFSRTRNTKESGCSKSETEVLPSFLPGCHDVLLLFLFMTFLYSFLFLSGGTLSHKEEKF